MGYNSPPLSDFRLPVMFRFAFPLLFFCLLCISTPVWGDLHHRIWGGSNQTTTYSHGFVPALHQPAQMNLGAPPPAIPVQATHATQAIDVPQASIPTITIPAGPVGSVGRPATFPAMMPQAPPGAEIVFVLPASNPANTVINIDGQQGVPATEARVVPPHTPGAVPVILKTVTVQQPRVEYQWTYAPIVSRTETVVNVVCPRTHRIVQTFTHEDTASTLLPWLHRREVITYETVEVRVAVPVSMAPASSSAVNTFIHGGL